jgi:hypothetical protein
LAARWSLGAARRLAKLAGEVRSVSFQRRRHETSVRAIRSAGGAFSEFHDRRCIRARVRADDCAFDNEAREEETRTTQSRRAMLLSIECNLAPVTCLNSGYGRDRAVRDA